MADVTTDAKADQTTTDNKTAETGDKTSEGTGQETPDLLKVISEKGLKEEFEKYVKGQVQSETDRRVTQAVKTHEEKLLKELEEKQKADKTKLDKEKNMSDEQKKISDLEGKLEKMTDMFNEFMGKTQEERLLSARQDALSNAGLPQSLAKRMLSKKPEDIPGEIEELKKEYLDIQQEEIDKRIKEQDKPLINKVVGDKVPDAKFKEHFKQKTVPDSGVVMDQLVKN